MRFFRNLFGPRNPTLGWVRDPSRALELDLDASALSGIPLGSAFDELAFLGPARKARHSLLWEFPPVGVAAEESEGRIEGLFVVPIPDEHFSVDAYGGSVVIGGRPVSYQWISREQDVIRLFGTPTRRDDDPEESVLFYERGGVERQIELTPKGRIKTIAIFTPG